MTQAVSPQDIDDRTWYYEDKEGIGVVRRIHVDGVFHHTDQFKIPWEMVRRSLARKDHRKVPK
jgi:hypothetical protein